MITINGIVITQQDLVLTAKISVKYLVGAFVLMYLVSMYVNFIEKIEKKDVKRIAKFRKKHNIK